MRLDILFDGSHLDSIMRLDVATIQFLERRGLVGRAKELLGRAGYDPTHWVRVVMYRHCVELLRSLEPGRLDALEISAGERWKELGFRSFTETQFPAFDICQGRLPQTFDVIIADQVFEHLLYPNQAAKNVYAMLRPQGHFLIATPFLIRRHDVPVDCTRWTELGMKYFLAENGFMLEEIRTWSWGNRACVKANLRRFVRRGWFRSLRNEVDYPVTVWALARKT